MSNHNLAGLSDKVGELVPSTPDEEALALRWALRITGNADEVAHLAEMLGIGRVGLRGCRMNPIDWSSPLWGVPGHNVHVASSGTWADAEPTGDEQ
jgi:hypothetical protein